MTHVIAVLRIADRLELVEMHSELRQAEWLSLSLMLALSHRLRMVLAWIRRARSRATRLCCMHGLILPHLPRRMRRAWCVVSEQICMRSLRVLVFVSIFMLLQLLLVSVMPVQLRCHRNSGCVSGVRRLHD